MLRSHFMRCLAQLLSLVSLLWILFSVQGLPQPSFSGSHSASHHSDFIHIELHAPKDLIQNSVSSAGAITLPATPQVDVVLEARGRVLERTIPFRRKVYLFFPTGLSPPLHFSIA